MLIPYRMVSLQKFGFDTTPLADLIHWGDIIDGAQYATPQSAVAMAEPATQLALVTMIKNRFWTAPLFRLNTASANDKAVRVNRPPSMADQTVISEICTGRLSSTRGR